MGLVLLVVLGALGVGALRGGSPRRLSAVRLRARRLVVLAVLLQLAGGLAALAGSSAVYDAGLILSAVVILAFCWRNATVPGVPLIGLGLTLNAVVVAVNGAMPVSYLQAARAGADVSAISAAADPRHELAGDATSLGWLGDVIPVPLPLRAEVDSPGDLLIAAGLGEFVVLGMGARPRAGRRRAPRRPQPDRLAEVLDS